MMSLTKEDIYFSQLFSLKFVSFRFVFIDKLAVFHFLEIYNFNIVNCIFQNINSPLTHYYFSSVSLICDCSKQ